MSDKIKRAFSNLKALFRYSQLNAALKKKRNLFFFFPSWSFGGAERVHIDILNLFRDQELLCLITERSKSDGFRKDFEAAAEVIELGRWAEKKSYKRHLHKRMARTINARKKPVIFGWGSRFMYDLIPLLKPHVRIIDLIHNFTDDGDGIEFYSLPHVPRIEKRILVGKAIINQFKELYKSEGIPENYLDRLVVIHNKITFDNELPKKNYMGTLQVLFVARNSPEKRPQVFVKTARLCYDAKLPIEFKMIGDFHAGQMDIPPNIEVVGEVHDQIILKKYYKEAQLLLLTSHRESWGLVIFEGMKYGVVPISTVVGELASYISVENKNGILIPNIDDDDALAELFKKEIEFLHRNRSLLKILSINGFETVKNICEKSDFDESYKKLILG